jgi:hypothetical protein
MLKLMVPVLAVAACTFATATPALAQISSPVRPQDSQTISLVATATSATVKFTATYKESVSGDRLTQRMRVDVVLPPLVQAKVAAGGKPLGVVTSAADGKAAIELSYEGSVRTPGLPRLKAGDIVQVGALMAKLTNG